ncbi:MAG: tetratricopeptide repeat protein [Cyanobacteria bacterium REEB67]|nr:tetratricopeptide repeat protein [Cyanobacteria bacterium REEB67]
MSETRTNEGETAAAGADKLMMQARMALKTGMSAYENGNYAFAETLLVKALDLFEQAKGMEDKGYFQALHQTADTYFQLGRYFEAKSYYERLSVARLKNPESTDVQVVVALLKLASTYQKLGEGAEALTAFDLIMELAEKTIPNGHALFGVIFDSYEDLIARSVDDPDERARREEIVVKKREQFGFPKATTEARWAHAVSEPGTATEVNPDVLAQAPDQIRHTLKAWTHSVAPKPEAPMSEVVSRVNQERLAELESNMARPHEKREDGEKHMQAHLHPNMFKRRSKAEMEAEEALLVEREAAFQSSNSGSESGVDHDASTAIVSESEAEEGSGAIAEANEAEAPLRKFSAERGALKGAKRPNTDRKRFNPLPALTVIACIAGVAGAVFIAHEYAKNAALNSGTVPVATGKDFSGVSWAAADNKKMLRCTSAATCSYIVSGTTAGGTYQVKGQPGAEKSILSDFFNGKPTRLTYVESEAGLKGSDGTILYSENSKDRLILNKAQAIANFATYYFASHSHFYPGSAQDFQFNNARFAWENPISGEVNKPVVKKVGTSKPEFDNDFTTQLKSMREGKAIFDADSGTTSNAGLIECLALIPPAPNAATPGEDASCAFLIRGYDAEGKLINSSDPSKVFVIALKNGISIDPIKALHEEASAPVAPAGKVEVEIEAMPDPVAAPSKK